jgi:hypothetical protein
MTARFDYFVKLPRRSVVNKTPNPSMKRQRQRKSRKGNRSGMKWCVPVTRYRPMDLSACAS